MTFCTGWSAGDHNLDIRGAHQGGEGMKAWALSGKDNRGYLSRNEASRGVKTSILDIAGSQLLTGTMTARGAEVL